MLFYIKDNHEHILVFDIEFDNFKLVQFAGVLLKRLEKNVYIKEKQLNIYVRTEVSYMFSSYTGISQKFLDESGTDILSVKAVIEEELLQNVDKKSLLLCSHGITNDLIVLNRNGIDIRGEKDAELYCTFTKSKKIFKKERGFGLESMAMEACYYQIDAHNALDDALATLSLLSYLKWME